MSLLHNRILLTVGASAVSVSAASAAMFDDAETGAWNTPATWGGADAPTSAADDVTIDEHTVTANTTTFTGGAIHLLGAGADTDGRLFLSYNTTSAAPTTFHFEGGTLDASRATIDTGGITLNVTANTTSKLRANSNGEVVNFGNNTIAGSTTLTGSGTLLKTGYGTVRWHSNTAAEANNASDFSGTVDIREGRLNIDHPNQLGNATVILTPYVKTLEGPPLVVTNEVSNLHQTSLGAVAWGQMKVKNLHGTGVVSWGASNYSNDLVIQPGGTLNPGTADAPGTITRSTATNRNELKFATDAAGGNSTLVMDIFGPTAAEADRIVWTDAANISLLDLAGGDLVVKLFTPSESLAQTEWVLIDGDEFGIASGSSGTDASDTRASREFASNLFLDLAGNPIDLWDGTAEDSGWTNLDVLYTGTHGSGDRDVVLTGSYVRNAAVPEPGAVSVLMAGALGLLARRRRQPQT